MVEFTFDNFKYGNDKRINVKIVNGRNPERLAILARRDDKAQWTQIESILGEAKAVKFAEEMEMDLERRVEAIAGEHEGQGWRGPDGVKA